MSKFVPQLDFRKIYDRFNTPVTSLDCGAMCAPYNPNGKPFCCDICEAVPATYKIEWDYLQNNTDLWHLWRGDECEGAPEDPSRLLSATVQHQTLVACLGPVHCQREFRAVSCRQFPFFPYVTEDYRFLGLTYEWHFEQTCWVISHLDLVTRAFQTEFVNFFDEIFALWQDEFESYAVMSSQMRYHFIKSGRRIPILHRNGSFYLLSPGSERITKAAPEKIKKFGPYNNRGGNSNKSD